jgi:hypothetical protein
MINPPFGFVPENLANERHSKNKVLTPHLTDSIRGQYFQKNEFICQLSVTRDLAFLVPHSLFANIGQ